MLLERILKDIGDIKTCRKITVVQLHELGYIVSTRRMVIANPKEEHPVFYVAEILDEDTKTATSFCYLYSINKRTGVILKHKYDYYVELAS
jgi:hypothetical protein